MSTSAVKTLGVQTSETLKDEYVNVWKDTMMIIDRIKEDTIGSDYGLISKLQENLEILDESPSMFDLVEEGVFKNTEDMVFANKLIYELNRVVNNRDTLMALLTIMPLYDKIQKSDKIIRGEV